MRTLRGWAHALCPAGTIAGDTIRGTNLKSEDVYAGPPEEVSEPSEMPNPHYCVTAPSYAPCGVYRSIHALRPKVLSGNRCPPTAAEGHMVTAHGDADLALNAYVESYPNRHTCQVWR